MAEAPNEVKRHIDSTRRQLGEDLNALQHKVKRATDWRTYVEERPLTMAMLAFTGGVLVSALSSGPNHQRNGYRFNGSASAEPKPASPGTQYQKHRAADTWDSIKGALIGVAAAEFKNMLTQTVPGFREQYEKTEQKKERSSGVSPQLSGV